MKITRQTQNLIIYFGIIILALVFLYIGNNIAAQGMVVVLQNTDGELSEARVRSILDINTESEEWWSSTTVTFEAQIIKGVRKNEIITAAQSYSSFDAAEPAEIKAGDKVLLVYTSPHLDSSEEWYYSDHVRINKLIILGVVFVVLLLIFGRIKGLNAILSLGFTCIAIFAVFIPAILSGKNIYLWSVLICIYVIIFTLFILNGVNKKSIAAAAGCFGGVIVAGVITLFMNGALRMTGWINSESIYLVGLQTETPIDLIAIIFAGIIIGAVGAIMDVSVSISSALWELKEKAPGLSFGGLVKSGINIGEDIMGSMANTLVLAYIGSSLTIILLLIVYSGSFSDLLNRELVTVEILQALVGSLGILLTMPLTALICGALYSRKR